jgi:hypothetical protein
LFAIFPFAIELVVTLSPSLKALDPEIIPVMDPSTFFFHLDIVGTPRGAVRVCAIFCGGAFLGAGKSSSTAPKPKPNNEKVARGLAFLTAAEAACASRSFLSFVKVIVEPGFAPARSLIAAMMFACFTASSELKK